MHGFYGSYGILAKWDLFGFEDCSLVHRTKDEKNFHLTQITLPKFLHDKYFEEIEDCFLAIEGVLLEADTPIEAIRRYKAGDVCFWDSWRGSFCGVLYDSSSDSILLFNDHTGSKMLFYTQTAEGLFFASDLRTLAQATHSNMLNTNYVSDILEYGYSEGNETFVKNVYRLIAGQYLHYQKKHIRLGSYHTFSNTPATYNEERMIHESNRLFRQAVERVVRKNEQEKLEHFYPLSGGLDSRITQWVARQLTRQPITNFTYSQTGHYDHLLPKKISKLLGNKWCFLPLDGGQYITEIDEVCSRTEWLVNYMIPVEPNFFAKTVDWRNVGVVLTGLNGDNIFATETDNSHELAKIYSQGFSGYSIGSPLIMQHFTETYSPFCDVDVLDYVLHIPTCKRRNYYFYDRFVLTCYPEAAQWHHKHVQIGHRPAMITLFSRNIPLADVPKRVVWTILKRLHIYDGYRATEKESMNPYDDWMKENPEILDQIQHYYSEHHLLISNFPWYKACEEKMRFGSMMEKGKVLTILSAIKNLNLQAY